MSKKLGTCAACHSKIGRDAVLCGECGYFVTQPAPAPAEPVAGETKLCPTCRGSHKDYRKWLPKAGGDERCGDSWHDNPAPAERVAGETKKSTRQYVYDFMQLPYYEQWGRVRRLGLSEPGDENIRADELIVLWAERAKKKGVAKELLDIPDPSVAVPEGEATNVKGESIDLWTNEYLVQRMLENYARTLATGSESQHNEAFRCRAEVIRRMAAHVLAEKGK